MIRIKGTLTDTGFSVKVINEAAKKCLEANLNDQSSCKDFLEQLFKQFVYCAQEGKLLKIVREFNDETTEEEAVSEEGEIPETGSEEGISSEGDSGAGSSANDESGETGSTENSNEGNEIGGNSGNDGGSTPDNGTKDGQPPVTA